MQDACSGKPAPAPPQDEFVDHLTRSELFRKEHVERPAVAFPLMTAPAKESPTDRIKAAVLAIPLWFPKKREG